VHSQLSEVHGPALVHDMVELLNNCGQFFRSSVTSDFVRCIRCPVWPLQAAEWPQRRRYSGWPDSVTVNSVVSQGCDVVPVSHPCHKDDTSQWRLSFSRAEVVLLNSWTNLQQIVYHMLRFFVKTERLLDNTEASNNCDRLSMYHIKTLMLWACELQPSNRWETSTVIQLCRELLNTLGTFLLQSLCDHYFIKDCNLLHYVSSADRHIEYAAYRLISVTDLELADWFVQNYLKRYAAYNCSSDVQQLLCHIETSVQLERALSAVVDWRIERFRYKSLGQLESAMSNLSTFLSRDITARTCKIYDAERDVMGPLHGVFIAFVFLKCAGEIRAGHCLYDLYVLATAAGRGFGAISDLFEKCDGISAETLEKLMACWHRCISAESSSMSPQIYTELTKAFLHLALKRCDRHEDDSVHCLATVYLAVLYYISGNYQTAVAFCEVITSKRSNHFTAAKGRKIPKVDAQLISEYDSDIATVCGFISLHDYVKGKLLLKDSQHTKYHTSFYYAEALLRYIAVKCYVMNKVAAADLRLYEAIQQYRRYINESSNKLLLADVLLFRLFMAKSPQFRCRPVVSWSDHIRRPDTLNAVTAKYDTVEFSEMLIQLAVERLAEFREFQVRTFGSDCVARTTGYEALNCYRCRQYDRCLLLSQDIVNDVMFMSSMPTICVDSPQLVLMDDDSLLLPSLD